MIKDRVVETTHPIVDADIVKALGLKCAMCYGALALCRALGRADEDNAWWLASNHTIVELLEEAKERGIDLSSAQTEVEHQPLLESMKYRRAVGEITEREYVLYARDVQSGKRDI